MEQQQKMNETPYKVKRSVGALDISFQFIVCEEAQEHYVFIGTENQCQDFAYLMNMARSGRFLVVS